MVLHRIQRADPLYAVLHHVFSTPLLGALIAGLTHVGIWVILCVVVQLGCSQMKTQNVLAFMNDPFGWFQWAIVVPVIWFYYRWSPEGVQNTIERLCRNEVIICSGLDSKGTGSVASDVEGASPTDALARSLGRPLWTWLSVAFAVVVVAAQYWVVRPTEIKAGLVSVWYATRWSALVLEPITGINAYISAQFSIRVLVSAVVLANWLSTSKVRQVFLLHPDGGGGFGQLGRLSMRVAFLAVLMGFWAAGITLAPVLLAGGRPNFSSAVLSFYAVYIALAASILSGLLWPAHVAMKGYKAQRLQALSLEIQNLLDFLIEHSTTDPEATAVALSRLDDLRDLYATTVKIPEWPISLPEFRLFGGVAVLPAIVGVASFAMDLAQNWPF